MVHLKNPDGQIPNGLRFLQAETGWDSTKMIGKFPSMDTLVRGVITHRNGNAWLIQKHGWLTEYQDVLREMRDYNARLCLQHGWNKFISTDEESPAPTQKKNSVPVAKCCGR